MSILLLLPAGGCRKDHHEPGEQFPPAGANRATRQFIDAQAASGARADAMLYPHHFDGGRLNSLGRAKLDRMIEDDESLPVVIYLNLSEKDEAAEDRKESVAVYLKDRGVLESQAKLLNGPNPASVSPAAVNLAGSPRTDTLTTGSAGGVDGSVGTDTGIAK